MQTETFSIPTADQKAQLSGELGFQSELTKPQGVLLIVPGGWFTERDGFFGDSYTNADLMYKRLAKRVVEQGYVVARYDNRGVTGNELTIGLRKESSDPTSDSHRYIQTCVDPEIRKSVTPETLASDVASVYGYVAGHSAVDEKNIAVFAHSEGGLHVARLLREERIIPKGVLLAGVITQSPAAIMRWQMIDRYIAEVMSWDCDSDGRVLAHDVSSHYPTSLFADVGISESDLQPPDYGWNQERLREFFASRYEQEKTAALSIDDQVPFPHNDNPDQGFVAASHRWWKQWFVSETSTTDLLANYRGKIVFHFGEIDSQLSAANQIEYLNKQAKRMKANPRIVLHPARGHAFRTGAPGVGPMDQEAEDVLVRDILSLLK